MQKGNSFDSLALSRLKEGKSLKTYFLSIFIAHTFIVYGASRMHHRIKKKRNLIVNSLQYFSFLASKILERIEVDLKNFLLENH